MLTNVAGGIYRPAPINVRGLSVGSTVGTQTTGHNGVVLNVVLGVAVDREVSNAP